MTSPASPPHVRPAWLALKIPPLLLLATFALPIIATPAITAWPIPAPVRWGVGLFVTLAGAAVCLAGVLAFRQARTTVNPKKPSNASTLVVRGIYHYSRNPMYLGFALMLLGLGIGLGKLSALLWLMGFVGYLQRYQIRPEEQALHARFGADYLAYCARVGRWISLCPTRHTLS